MATTTKELENIYAKENSSLANDLLNIYDKAEADEDTTFSFGENSAKEKDFDISIEQLDQDQMDLIFKNHDQSMIVSGCAGSGKSLVAAKKAIELSSIGNKVAVISYTKSLTKYMNNATNCSNIDCFYLYQVINHKCDFYRNVYSHVIIDEAQDFTPGEIDECIKRCKSFFICGDSAQSIYRKYKSTYTIEEIAAKYNLPIFFLYKNYRLPRTIAKITQNYLGLGMEDDVRPYSEKLYLSEEDSIPTFIKCQEDSDQLTAILDLINELKGEEIGILLPDNESVISLCRKLTERKIQYGYKYNSTGSNSGFSQDKLDLGPDKINLLTYHSAKGLQFKNVIIPYYKGLITSSSDSDKDYLRSLYVAITRSYCKLFVIFTDELGFPLNTVPTRLYNLRKTRTLTEQLEEIITSTAL